MGRVLPAFYQFFDDEGDVLSQGWLKFLEPSTNNTPKSTYADENLTIANANPLQLSAAGRMPDAFGTGKYRIVSYKYDPADPLTPGEQVQIKDPVQAEGATSGGAGGFEAWDNAVTYQLNDIVEHNNLLYRSLIVDNLGNNPTIETTLWEQVDFIRYWNAAISYAAGDLVYYSSNLYLSLQSSNLNYNPATRMDYWRAVATGIANISYKTDDYEVGIGEVSYLFVLAAATLTDKTFTLPPVTTAYDKYTIWIANDSDYDLSITAQLTADIWLEDPVIITKGAMVELTYSGTTDHWHVTGAGPVLGGQDIGTDTNRVDVYSDAVFLNSITSASDMTITSGGGIDAVIAAGNDLTININSIDYWVFDSTGPILPGGSNPLADIGASGNAINDIFCADITATSIDTASITNSGGVLTVSGIVSSVIIGDAYELYLGDDQDLEVYHDGSNATIENNTGSLTINNRTAGQLIFQTQDATRWLVGSGGDLVPGSAGAYDIGTTAAEVGNFYQGDNCTHYLGDSQDFSIVFNGSNGVISCTGGNLYLSCSVGGLGGEIHFQTAGGDRWFISAAGDLVPVLAGSYNLGGTANEIHHIYQATASNHYFDSSQTYYITSGGAALNLVGPGALDLDMGGIIYIRSGGSLRWQFNAAGHFVPATNNTYDIGESATRVKTIYSVNALDVSDYRYKRDIKESEIGLDFILKLNPVQFRLTEYDDDRTRYGLIAQEVAELIDYDIFSGIHHDKKSDRWDMDYKQFIAPLIQSVKELSQKIDNLQKIEPDNK